MIMAGKASAFASYELFATLEKALTKNQLIDFVVTDARAHVRGGDDLATISDADIIAWIQPRIEQIWKARGDPKIDLLNRYAIYSPNKKSAKK